MKYATIFLAFGLLVKFSALFGQLSAQPYSFDFGPEDSEVAENSIRASPITVFSATKGFGWLVKPQSGFVNEPFTRSRDAFNIDGVTGPELDYLLKLPAGEWLVTLYADAGYEDSSTVVLSINRQVIELDWHAFQPPAEPYKEVQSGYRVYQGWITVKDSLRLNLSGGDYDARWLGLSVIPKIKTKGATKKKLENQIAALGKYGEEEELDEVYAELKSLMASNPNDPFYTYWYQQVGLLMRAELHYERRGWEKYIKTTGLSIWGQLHQAVMLLDGLLNHSTPETNLLYERELFLRARILYGLGLERGGPNEIARGREDLAELYSMYPKDQLLAMYNGEKIDLPDDCDALEANPNAPQWSVKQRELLCRMRDIAHWWVLEQQAENGEFGGKIGDDVELLRWWTPVLLSGDSLAFVGWSKLADEIFQNRKIYKGYSKKAIDVEHASEFIADTAPMMVVCSDEKKYLDRLEYSVDYFINLWTGKSINDRRFFRSAWFSSTEVDENPPRNRDHGYNSRAVKAVRYYAWKTQDEEALTALNEWSEAWLSAAMRTDKDKPLGIMPASIRFPDEAFNGDEQDWYTANMFWNYFEWEASPGSKILDQLLFSYIQTRDEKYLQPLMKSLELIQKYEGVTGDREIGSEEWAVDILKDKGGFWSVAAQWRFLTGDKKFDDLLLTYGTPYLKYRLTADAKYLEQGLDIVLENARYNTPLKTYEALHTDRVYIRGYEHLTTMLTGNGSQEGLSPNYAVTWEDTGEGFTALVQESSLEEIKVVMYDHSDKQERVKMRLWQLEPGDYRVIINGDDRSATPLNIKTQGQRLEVKIPANELMTVEIKS